MALEPAVHTSKEDELRFRVLITLIPEDVASSVYVHRIMGVLENPERLTLVHDAAIVAVPYFTLNGSRAALSVPDVMLLAE